MEKNLELIQQRTLERTKRNAMKSFNELQRELALIGILGKPKRFDDSLISLLEDYSDAIRLCIKRSNVKRSQSEIASILGLSKSHFSEILSGNKHLPGDLKKPIEWLCGNRAISQYEWMRDQQLKDVLESPVEKIQRLEAELEALRRKAA